MQVCVLVQSGREKRCHELLPPLMAANVPRRASTTLIAPLPCFGFKPLLRLLAHSLRALQAQRATHWISTRKATRAPRYHAQADRYYASITQSTFESPGFLMTPPSLSARTTFLFAILLRTPSEQKSDSVRKRNQLYSILLISKNEQRPHISPCSPSRETQHKSNI